MKNLLISFLICVTLTACSFDGFRPPKSYDTWLHKVNPPKYVPQNILYIKRQDMIDCGVDLVTGDSNSAKSSLCMESKGWYLERGPACEDQGLAGFYDDPLCVQWRAKRYKK